MIIIKNIILYFIQIRHADDFPLNGYPASYSNANGCTAIINWHSSNVGAAVYR